MKPVITILLIALWCSVSAQQDPRPGDVIDTITSTLDTIDLNAQSKAILQKIEEGMAQLRMEWQDLEDKRFILLTGAGIDPKKVKGFTKDYKIITEK